MQDGNHSPRSTRVLLSGTKKIQEKGKRIEDISGKIGDKAFDAYFSASETANMTKDERILYDHAMITKTDIEYGKLYSFKKGLAEGEAKGRTEVARAMLKEDIPFETICRITGFTPQQMELISKTL